MQSKKTPNWLEDQVTTGLAIIPAAILFCILVLLGKVIWPAIKWLASKTWALLRAKTGKRASVLKLKKNELPTPEIFKGAKNLAPAKQIRF